MKIEKKELIYCSFGEHGWESVTFMTSHAMPIDEGRICIWGEYGILLK